MQIVLLQSPTWMSHVTHAEGDRKCHVTQAEGDRKCMLSMFPILLLSTSVAVLCSSLLLQSLVAVSCCSLLLQSPRWMSHVTHADGDRKCMLSVSPMLVFTTSVAVSLVAVSCCRHPHEWVMSHMQMVIASVCCQCLRCSRSPLLPAVLALNWYTHRVLSTCICVRACVRACLRACVRACVRACPMLSMTSSACCAGAKRVRA